MGCKMELQAWDILKLWLKQLGEFLVVNSKYAENTAVVLCVFVESDR